MTTTNPPVGPVLDTSAAPSVGARMVEAQKPDLLLTQDHHMCPGCGEPIAVRQFLETITQLDAVERAIGVAGIGCYTSFSGSMDVDLVQALHGRAPSVATLGPMAWRRTASCSIRSSATRTSKASCAGANRSMRCS